MIRKNILKKMILFCSLFLLALRYIFKTQFRIDLDVKSYVSKIICISCPQLGLNIVSVHFVVEFYF